jgi:hypothetical protein
MKIYIECIKVFLEILYYSLLKLKINFNIIFNKYNNLYLLNYVLGILVFLIELLYYGNVSYCDSFDNDLFSSREDDSIEYDGRPIYELDGRPVTYQPYRPGLQSTSQGYRYELDGSDPNLFYELDGRGIEYSRIRGPSAYQPHASSYKAKSRIVVDDYYGINRNNSSIYSGRLQDRVNTNPIDSEYYKSAYATNPLHNDTYHAPGESVIKKASKSIKKFVD